MAVETAGKLEIRLLGPREMAKVKQPDSEQVEWPADSFCICAFDEQGNLKGRVGMISLPHLEGFWVANDYLASGLADELMKKFEEVARERLKVGMIITMLPEVSRGLHRELHARQWEDMHLKVFKKEV